MHSTSSLVCPFNEIRQRRLSYFQSSMNQTLNEGEIKLQIMKMINPVTA